MGERQYRKQCCAFFARACFHTASPHCGHSLVLTATVAHARSGPLSAVAVTATAGQASPPGLCESEGDLPLSTPVKGRIILASKLPGIWRILVSRLKV